MRRNTQWLMVWVWVVLAGAMLAMAAPAAGATAQSYAKKVSSLVDPAKLSKLGKRGANPRVQKYTALLAEARAEGHAPEVVTAEALRMVGMKGEAAKLTGEVMVRNLVIAERLGCLGEAGLRDMKRGQSPTIQNGPHKGDELSVDHIIPRAVSPELNILPVEFGWCLLDNNIDQPRLGIRTDHL